MVNGMFHKMNKETRYKWSFYINIILFFIIGISIFLLIVDSYNAGKGVASGGDALSQAWLLISRDVAFLSISFALIFFQFFRNLLIIARRSL
jgi:hypothetical protein